MVALFGLTSSMKHRSNASWELASQPRLVAMAECRWFRCKESNSSESEKRKWCASVVIYGSKTEEEMRVGGKGKRNHTGKIPDRQMKTPAAGR